MRRENNKARPPDRPPKPALGSVKQKGKSEITSRWRGGWSGGGHGEKGATSEAESGQLIRKVSNAGTKKKCIGATRDRGGKTD